MTTERTLDWKSRHDPLSLQYGIRDEIGVVIRKRSKFWKCGSVLDQGREGACVGFGWTGELLASPKPNYTVSSEQGNEYALEVYHDAQTRDDWEGEDYEGTSVLAGAKAIQARGFMEGYRWAFSVEDVRDALITTGPVVIGIPWYESMYSTKENGLLEVSGSVVGGHCLLLTGYHPGRRFDGEGWFNREEVFHLRNSWGPDFGNNGNGWLKVSDLADLLKGQGEACVPVGRSKVKL